jgi:signal transduction histidine kinase
LKGKDGKVKTIMSLVQDITEQKQLERHKDNFFDIVSHELKTPLTTIKAYGQIAESMLEAKGDAGTLGMIKKMGSQVNKLTALVQDFLDFTKIQNGKLIYNEAFFDFNELVEEVIDDMQKISVTHEIKNNSGKTAAIFGDKDKFSQVLNNLISNAIKYSPKAGSIIISTQLQKDSIELSVQDFGIGILAQNQQSVFEQFYRVNEGNQPTFPGMGIGLYICSEIISRHSGKIWVESSIGKGSIFYIWLPFDHRNKTT